jgi:hypothetical protein
MKKFEVLPRHLLPMTLTRLVVPLQAKRYVVMSLSLRPP